MAGDTTNLILNQSPIPILNLFIGELYNLDTAIQEGHSINMALHGSIYIAAFDEVMLQSPCLLLEQVLKADTLENCQTFADGTID